MKKKQQSPEELAIEAVKNRNDNCTEFSVAAVFPRYLDGTLYIILFKSPEGVGFENYSYVPNDGTPVEVYRNTSQLAHAVSISPRASSPFERIATLGGTSGLIAVLITGTICFLALKSQGEIKIPEVLSGALTMVLGFYFGSKAAGRKE